MSDTIKIGDHEIELTELDEEDGYIADVMVIVRAVRPGEDGRVRDLAAISTTKHTTWMIQVGMIHAATELVMDDGDE